MKYDWIQIFEDQQSSGQTIAAYCASHSIPVGSFYKHKQRLKQTPSTITITPMIIESEVIQFKINGHCIEFNESNIKHLSLVLKAIIHD
jgi:hypothetical protein